MKIGISIKIDVSKIDKARIFKGEKGNYMDLTTFIDLDVKGEYGDNGFITQSPSKVKSRCLYLVTVRYFMLRVSKRHSNHPRLRLIRTFRRLWLMKGLMIRFRFRRVSMLICHS